MPYRLLQSLRSLTMTGEAMLPGLFLLSSIPQFLNSLIPEFWLSLRASLLALPAQLNLFHSTGVEYTNCRRMFNRGERGDLTGHRGFEQREAIQVLRSFEVALSVWSRMPLGGALLNKQTRERILWCCKGPCSADC